MKKFFIIIILISSIMLPQTSRFTRYFQYSSGQPITGVDIELLPSGNTYPTGAVAMTEHPSRTGYYYVDGINHGNYDVYIDGSLYEQNIWIGNEEVSIAVNKFDPNGKLSGNDIEDETISGNHISDTTITNRMIKDDAINSYKILDETIQMIDLSPDVINAIIGGITPIADSGKINTTGNDYLWGNYYAYGGMFIGSKDFIFSLQDANYFRLPAQAPQVNLYGQLWYTTALNRGLFLHNNSSSNDTIPSLYLLRQLGYLPYVGSDSGKVNTTGTDYTWGDYTHYGKNYFNGGLRVPLSGYLNKAGEIWFNPATLKYYGRLEDESNAKEIITEASLETYAGSSSINTLGTITTGTWNATPIAVTKGGTGATSATQALTNLLPSQPGNSGKALITNGTSTYWGSVSGTASIANYKFTFQADYQTDISVGSYTAYKLVVIDVTVAQGGNTLTTISNGTDLQRVVVIGDYVNQDDLTITTSGNIRTLSGQDLVLNGNKSIELIYYSDEGNWYEVGTIRDDLYMRKSGGTFTGSVITTKLSSDPVQLTGQAPTLNGNLSNIFYYTLTDDATITLSNIGDGQVINIVVIEGAAGAASLDWSPAIKWRGGSAPAITIGSTDIISIMKIGNDYYGNISQNYY